MPIGGTIPKEPAMRVLNTSMLFVLALSGTSAAEPRQHAFDDPMFRRCLTWMLDGQRGAGLNRVCLDEYEIPGPSLFLCARKVETGFLSSTDREVCAIVFEEQVKRVKAGFLRCAVSGRLSNATAKPSSACSTD
jgi:hypothetical protein